MTTLLKVNKNGPAHLCGLRYLRKRAPKKLPRKLICVSPCKTYSKVKFESQVEVLAWLEGSKEWYGKGTWTGTSKKLKYAMPARWFTELPT